MPAPFFIAGAVYILQRLSGTFTRFVWRPTGLVDLLENPPEEIRREHPQLFDAVGFLIDLNEGFAYDLTTKEGLIELTADLAALGVKGLGVKFGASVAARVLAALGVGVTTRAALNLPESLNSLVALITSDDPLPFLTDLAKAYNRATALLEGKGGTDAASLVQKGTKAVLDTAGFAQSLGSFVNAPSVTAAPGLILKGFDVVIGLLDFVVAALPFLPERVSKEEREEIERLNQETLDEAARQSESVRLSQAAAAARVREEAEMEEEGIVAKEALSQVPITIAPSLPGGLGVAPGFPPSPGFAQIGPPLTGFQTATPESLLPLFKTSRLGAPFNRFRGIGVSDLRRLVEEAKKR